MGTSIVSGLMTTTATGLTRMSWVNLLNTNTALLSLVGNEAIELSKRPTMHLAFVVHVLVVLAAPHLGSLTNISEIFKNDGCTTMGTGNYLFREDMITIPVKVLLLLSNLFEMSLSRFSSFGLQFAFEAKRATVNLFPSLVAEELFVRGDSRTIETQVNPNDGIIFRDNRFGYGENNMQPPFAFFTDEVCSCTCITLSIRKV